MLERGDIVWSEKAQAEFRVWNVHSVTVEAIPLDRNTLGMRSCPVDNVSLVCPARWKQRDRIVGPYGLERVITQVLPNGRAWANGLTNPLLTPDKSSVWIVHRDGVKVRQRGTTSPLRASTRECPECRGQGFVELFLGPSACKSCFRGKSWQSVGITQS